MALRTNGSRAKTSRGFHFLRGREALLPSIHISSVRNDADDNLSRSFVCEVEDSIIADAHAPAVSILKLLTTGPLEKGLASSERRTPAIHFCTAARKSRRQTSLLRVASDFDAPAHTRIRRSFSTSRSGSCGWCRRASSATPPSPPPPPFPG